VTIVPDPAVQCGKICIVRCTGTQFRENVADLNHQYVNWWETTLHDESSLRVEADLQCPSFSVNAPKDLM
jgi:hypothetical protein